MGYAKVISKKRRKEKKKRVKNGHKSVRDIENNGYSDVRLKKKREENKMNKIAHVLSQKYFQVSRERYVFKE